jgi:opacity protein-like surface antigen
MRRLALNLVFIILICASAGAQITRIGGGLAYGTGYWFDGTKVEEYRSPHFALFAEGVYRITTPIHVAASFSYFYPHFEKYTASKTAVNAMMFDINGHYVLNALDKFEFYALAGVDFLLTSYKYKITGAAEEDFKTRDNAIGLNAGGGVIFNLSPKMSIFSEAKYVVSKYGQFMANAGVFINVSWLAHHEQE